MRGNAANGSFPERAWFAAWVLARDPVKEARNLPVGAEKARRIADPLQFRIRKACVECSMANRMDWPFLAAAPAFRHGVMPLDALAERAGAEPACR